ncbi:MAG: FKBP-type peptidyl-prolyl cis-trans isomerase [Candidatus Eisenbacteria bacterium]|nr:FKBP-type peptidyl-prolyl cis-trans isomerase [Candidatus Eisenbacteria bacterium]
MSKLALWIVAGLLFAAVGCNQSGAGGNSSATAGADSKSSATSTGTSTTGGATSSTARSAMSSGAASSATAGSAVSSTPKEVTMPNGLKYEDLRVGDGAIAESGMTATVNYTGWLTDGTKFDSSLDSGKPFSFRLDAGQVIRGWDEGVKGMRVGGKRKLTIPPDLGYGAAGAGGAIPPNATLVFDVELLGVR